MQQTVLLQRRGGLVGVAGGLKGAAIHLDPRISSPNLFCLGGQSCGATVRAAACLVPSRFTAAIAARRKGRQIVHTRASKLTGVPSALTLFSLFLFSFLK